jgi:hypothetical protein
MTGKKGAISNTRGIFSGPHDAGKGDQPRALDKQKYDLNFETINWRNSDGSPRKKHVVRFNNRTRIHYR